MDMNYLRMLGDMWRCIPEPVSAVTGGAVKAGSGSSLTVPTMSTSLALRSSRAFALSLTPKLSVSTVLLIGLLCALTTV